MQNIKEEKLKDFENYKNKVIEKSMTKSLSPKR